jgi:RHS repeat-associated protein
VLAFIKTHRSNTKNTALQTRHNYTYAAFGTLKNETGETENQYLFAGEQWHKNLNEYYLRQRSYNVETGRFNVRDFYGGNLLEPSSLHKYGYAYNDPINGIDPSGLFSIKESITGLAILSALVTAGAIYFMGKSGSAWTQLTPGQRSIMTKSYPSYIPFLSTQTQQDNENKIGIFKKGDGCWSGNVPRRGEEAASLEEYPIGNAYATYVTRSRFDFFVMTPLAIASTFDGRVPGTNQLWETKYGSDFFFNLNSRAQDSIFRSMLSRFDAERIPGLNASRNCGYSYTWAFSSSDLRNRVASVWNGVPPTVHIPFSPGTPFSPGN